MYTCTLFSLLRLRPQVASAPHGATHLMAAALRQEAVKLKVAAQSCSYQTKKQSEPHYVYAYTPAKKKIHHHTKQIYTPLTCTRRRKTTPPQTIQRHSVQNQQEAATQRYAYQDQRRQRFRGVSTRQYPAKLRLQKNKNLLKTIIHMHRKKNSTPTWMIQRLSAQT